jgi:hypothetical protein
MHADSFFTSIDDMKHRLDDSLCFQTPKSKFVGAARNSRHHTYGCHSRRPVWHVAWILHDLRRRRMVSVVPRSSPSLRLLLLARLRQLGSEPDHVHRVQQRVQTRFPQNTLPRCRSAQPAIGRRRTGKRQVETTVNRRPPNGNPTAGENGDVGMNDCL